MQITDNNGKIEWKMQRIFIHTSHRIWTKMQTWIVHVLILYVCVMMATETIPTLATEWVSAKIKLHLNIYNGNFTVTIPKTEFVTFIQMFHAHRLPHAWNVSPLSRLHSNRISALCSSRCMIGEEISLRFTAPVNNKTVLLLFRVLGCIHK